MRFMMFVKATPESEAGEFGRQEQYVAMGDLMQDMARAGILRAADGITPSSKGKRLSIRDGKIVKVTDGPFTETKELVAGFCMVEVPSWDDLTPWSERFAAIIGEGETEIRPLFEASDFPDDVFPPEEKAKEQALRDELQKQATAQLS
jgi:hypothetical protein